MGIVEYDWQSSIDILLPMTQISFHSWIKYVTDGFGEHFHAQKFHWMKISNLTQTNHFLTASHKLKKKNLPSIYYFIYSCYPTLDITMDKQALYLYQ